MKIRLTFVSNSSSSSYICEICGGAEAGYDQSLGELEMIECEYGHVFHKDCHGSISSQIIKEGEYSDQVVISSACPLCTLEIIPDEKLLMFLSEQLNYTREQVCQMFRTVYKSLDEWGKR